MAGKIFVNDNAGVFVRLIDKSQIPSEPRPKVMSGAFAINASRGLMNTIYFIENEDDMYRCFGKKNWRTLGKSMYDLHRYLEGGRPAYVVRVGPEMESSYDEDEMVTNASEKVATVEIGLKDYESTDHAYSTSLEDDGKRIAVKPAAVTAGLSYVAATTFTASDTNTLCRIFAKGEGVWGNDLAITISQTYPPKNNYMEVDADYEGYGDGKRIFSLEIQYQGKTVEQYPEVSFNPADIGKSGSIYIGNVLANSDYVGVAINDNIDPEEGLYVLPPPEPLVPEKGVWKTLFEGGGGSDLTLKSAAYAYGSDNRSNLFRSGLKRILDNYVETDAWLAFNAGQEITNSDFNKLFGDPLKEKGKTNRCLGLTAVPEKDSFKVPDNEGGVTSRWVSKWFQWLKGWDPDTIMDVMTSPVGWAGREIAYWDCQNESMKAIAGYRRGVLRGVTGISKVIKDYNRVKAVSLQWNPIRKDPVGFILYDALTSQTFKSAFSNIHVVLSFQRIRRDIEDTYKDFTFENNDENTVSTMLGLLNNLADNYKMQNYVEDIKVDAKDNQYGTDQIKINCHVTFKEAARTIIVDVIAYRSDQPLSVSMREA